MSRISPSGGRAGTSASARTRSIGGGPGASPWRGSPTPRGGSIRQAPRDVRPLRRGAVRVRDGRLLHRGELSDCHFASTCGGTWRGGGSARRPNGWVRLLALRPPSGHARAGDEDAKSTPSLPKAITDLMASRAKAGAEGTSGDGMTSHHQPPTTGRRPSAWARATGISIRGKIPAVACPLTLQLWRDDSQYFEVCGSLKASIRMTSSVPITRRGIFYASKKVLKTTNEVARGSASYNRATPSGGRTLDGKSSAKAERLATVAVVQQNINSYYQTLPCELSRILRVPVVMLTVLPSIRPMR